MRRVERRSGLYPWSVMSERPTPVARWTPPATTTQGTPRPSRQAPLDGCAPIQLEDVAPAKWTKQSTAAEEAAASYALPTQVEASPWWEIDLGKNLVLESMIAWIEPLDREARVRLIAYTVADRRGDPPRGSFVREVAAADLVLASDGSQALSLAFDVVARYARIQLLSGEKPVRLAVRGVQIFGASVFAGALAETYQRAFTLFADRPLFSARRTPGHGAFEVTHRYRDVWRAARGLSSALARRLERPATAIGKSDESCRIFIGLCTKNRAEWFISEVAAVLRGYVIVPLSPEDPEDRLRAIVSRCPVSVIVCEDASASVLSRIAEDHASLRLLVIVGDRREREPGVAALLSFDALVSEGGPAPPPPRERSPEDLHTLLFTSGSTGVPKGAMRSYRKFNAMLASYGVAQPSFHLSFQPLSHLSERHYLPAVVMNGSLVGVSSGGAHLLSDLAAFEPTWVSSVPRLFDVLYASYQRKLAAALAAEPDGDPSAIEASVLRAHRRAFGERVQGVSTGSAPVNPEVLAFLRRCFSDLWVMDGYGSTEVGTITFDNRISPNVEVKLAPIEGADRGEARPGGPERGEICVRSPHVIDGYYGEAEASAKSLDRDGFFRTGDLGERTADGGVRVIGRLSSAIKLGQGEFVSVDRIESDLSSCPLVDQIFVHPDASASSLLAVVIPNAGVLAGVLASELGRPELSAAEAAAHPEAARVVLAALRSHARKAGLARHEIPRAVLLDPEPMTAASGLLTTSGKLARRAAIDRYKDRLAALEGPGVAPEASVDHGDLAGRLAAIAGSIVRREVSPLERLSDGIGQDSLTSAEVLHAISEELGFTVPLAWWFEASSVADLARLIERRPGGAEASDAASQAARDRELVFGMDPEALPARWPPARVLVTGVTGLVGVHLLEELVHRSGAHLVCLVRAKDDAEARERVLSALDRYRVSALDPDRWSAIAGDLGAPRLGLKDGLWSALADDIDAVVHAGASVNWITVYSDLRAPNVLGALSLLELAASRRRKPFHYISTISTAPTDGDESTSLSFEQALASSAYGLSKWIAEEHVRRAGGAGLPVTIYRPGLVVGHSARGFGNPDDYVHRYLRACLCYGVYLDRPERLDMTPVDYVSQAVVVMLGASPEGGGVLHLCNVDQSMCYAELGRALAALGTPCSPVDYSTFRAAAVEPKDSPLRPLASYFPKVGFALGSGPWPSSATSARLAALSVFCPRIDERFIATVTSALADAS